MVTRDIRNSKRQRSERGSIIPPTWVTSHFCASALSLSLSLSHSRLMMVPSIEIATISLSLCLRASFASRLLLRLQLEERARFEVERAQRRQNHRECMECLRCHPFSLSLSRTQSVSNANAATFSLTPLSISQPSEQ